MKKEELLNRLNKIEGTVSFFYKNLITGETIVLEEDKEMMAASVIKIPILVETYRQIEAGLIRKEQIYTLRNEDKKPSCGVLNRLHEGIQLTVEDLCNLMIILSDNSATNILIHMLGMEQINQSMSEMGYQKIKLNRLMFDLEASKKGIQNYVSAAEIAKMLEKMYQGNLISKEADQEMLDILKEQRLNGKIPFYFTNDIKIAHKTGEDQGITHDVGIVFGKVPFILCFLGNQVDVPSFERVMQETTLELYCDLEEQAR